MAAKKPTKKLKDLPKKLTAKDASSVKGGSMTLNFAKVNMKYGDQ